jgi:GNAT superfamily N-acetyltransferase
MQIRSFHPGDSPGVKVLVTSVMNKEFPDEAKAYHYGDLENISGAYGKLREKFLVADEDSRIIGTAGIKEDSSSTALLRRLFVHPSHRGRGIGSMLIDTAVDFCRMNGYKQIEFRATSRMTQAINLLTQKKGFKEKERDFFGDVELIILHHKIQ